MGVCDYGRLRLNVISRNDRMTLKFLAFVIAYGGLPLAPHMHRTSRHAAPKKQKLNFRGSRTSPRVYIRHYTWRILTFYEAFLIPGGVLRQAILKRNIMSSDDFIAAQSEKEPRK